MQNQICSICHTRVSRYKNVNHCKICHSVYCKVHNALEDSRKELRDELKMIIDLLCHPGCFVNAKDIDRAKAVIKASEHEKRHEKKAKLIPNALKGMPLRLKTFEFDAKQYESELRKFKG